MADKLDGLIISEVLADNAGASATDVDGDGQANKADEFIEIQNTTNSTISLDGFELWSEKQGQLYAFGAGDTIDPGETATVLGEYTGTPPAGFYGATTNNGINWLPDGEGQKFDSIFLVNTTTGEYIVLSYGNPPRTPTLPNGFPGTTQVGAGEQLDSNAPNGVAFSRNSNGDFVEATTPTPGTPGAPCFCPGTLIDTLRGPVAVEDLRPGEMLVTRDAPAARLLGVRRFEIPARHLLAAPEQTPIRLPRGLFGATAPLQVSPNHRVLVHAHHASLLFGHSEVLVPAKSFLGYGGLQLRQSGKPLVYHHLLLAKHEILRAEGLWTESLFLGEVVSSCTGQLSRWDCVPGVTPAALHHTETARPVLMAYEAALLLSLILRDKPATLRRAA